MTGCEIYIKKGTELILFKVRHDGHEAEEWFTKAKIKKYKSPQALLDDFILYWNNNMASTGSEIQTSFPNGYCTKLPRKRMALSKIENFVSGELNKNHEQDGLNCGYQDCAVYVDFDNYKIKNNALSCCGSAYF